MKTLVWVEAVASQPTRHAREVAGFAQLVSGASGDVVAVQVSSDQWIVPAAVDVLAQQAVEEGCGRLEWAVLDWNAPSIAFYKQLGAQPMDEWTTFRLTGEALTRLAAG